MFCSQLFLKAMVAFNIFQFFSSNGRVPLMIIIILKEGLLSRFENLEILAPTCHDRRGL